ncbi:MAG: PAS domain-containing sensor histidine kinase [Chromatiales bacterium]
MIDSTPETKRDIHARLGDPATRAALFEAVLAASSDHIYLYDRAGRYLYASPAGARALGLSPEELTGKHWRELGFPAEIMEGFDRNRERVFDKGHCVSDVTAFPTIDGARRYQYSVCPIFDAEGGVIAAVCAASDMDRGDRTGRAERLHFALDEDGQLPVRWTTEAQLQQVADALPVLVSYIDPNERYRFTNKAYEAWFGIPAEQLRGRAVRDVIGEEAYAHLAEHISAALAGQGVSFTDEVPYQVGNRRLVQVRYIPDYEPDGRVRGFYAVVADVRRPPESARAGRSPQPVAHRPLPPGLAAIGEMTTEILHEIAQPITAIASYTEASIRLLRAEGEPPLDEILGWLEDMRAQATRAKEIIHRFRSFVSGGHLRRSLVDVNLVIDACANDLRRDIEPKGVELILELSAKPCPVSADRVLLEQALRNMTGNAVEALVASTGASRELRLTTLRDGPMVEIRVADRGPGVPADVRDRIFDPFFSTKPGGVGIGLAITRAIVEAHGGELVLSQTPGGGATFRFRLPLIHRSSEDHDPAR